MCVNQFLVSRMLCLLIIMNCFMYCKINVGKCHTAEISICRMKSRYTCTVVLYLWWGVTSTTAVAALCSVDDVASRSTGCLGAVDSLQLILVFGATQAPAFGTQPGGIAHVTLPNSWTHRDDVVKRLYDVKETSIVRVTLNTTRKHNVHNCVGWYEDVSFNSNWFAFFW